MNNRFTPDLTRTQALILAGGQGNHLYPLTVNRPKPAMPFGGIFRVVDFTLANCLRSRLPHVALLTQYQHQQLCSYIQYAWSRVWKNSRHTSEPLVYLPPSNGNCYKGTADAVFKNLAYIQSGRPEYVIVLSGDHVYSMDYGEILARHVELRADTTIAAVERPLSAASQFNVVEVGQDFGVMRIELKPPNPRPLPSRPERALVSMGVYVFKTDILVRSLMDNCEHRFGYDFEQHILPSLIGAAGVYAYNFRDDFEGAPGYWRDIRTIDRYYEASMELLRSDYTFTESANDSVPSQAIRRSGRARANIGCSRGTGIHIYSHVSRTVLSAGVRIERRGDVRDSVLMPGVWIGPGAAVRRAIVDEGVHIPAGFRIGWDVYEDRKRYVVSPAGVVVVNETPNLRKTGGDFEAFRRSNSLRASA
jgi:glucose-1-phosphate adenylyltransferase